MNSSPGHAPSPLLDQFRLSGERQPIIDDVFSNPSHPYRFNNVDEALESFFDSESTWLIRLMAVRNRIVARIGFETGGSGERTRPDSPVKTGDDLGLFTVADRSQEEILLGITDKRMDMRFSLAFEPESSIVSLATVAFPLDRIGTAYLTGIRIPHKLIAKSMAKKVAGRGD